MHFSSSSIDRTRLQSAIATLTLDCLHLKQLLRSTWTRPMAEEQRRLIRVRRSLTELFILLALSRKRLHVIRPPRDWSGKDWNATTYNETIATRILPEYTLVAEAEAASEMRASS